MSTISRRSRLCVETALLALLALVVSSTVSAASATELPTSVHLVSGTSPVTDATGQTWSPDSAYVRGGTVRGRPNVIAGTGDQSLYRTARFGQSGYDIPIANGTYTVRLNTSEPYWTSVGQRRFDVLAQGVPVARDVDIVRAVGPFHAYQLLFTVHVDTSMLRIGFIRGIDNPIVDSLSVQQASATSLPPGSVTAESFGARGDGITDDTAALQRAFDASAGRTVVLSAGRTYLHSGLLYLRSTRLTLTGAAVLLATVESQSSVWIQADDVTINGGLTIATRSTTQRWQAWEQMGVRVDGHIGATLSNITVSGSAAAGIYVGGATSFVIDHVTVRDTRADGIHVTAGSSYGQIVAPTIINSGDDGVAVVSYSADGPVCHDITVTSPNVEGTSGGRGLSVVGGAHITETDVHVSGSAAAGVYIAAEGSPWFTAAPTDVLIAGGVIDNANTDSTIDHGAVLVLGGASSTFPSTITVTGLTISGTRPTASRDLGVITYGLAPQNVLFQNISISGGPVSAYEGNTPQTSFRTRNIVQNGVALPDLGWGAGVSYGSIHPGGFSGPAFRSQVVVGIGCAFALPRRPVAGNSWCRP